MITYIIIGITVITSLMAFGNEKMMSNFMFNPFVIKSRNEYYRFFSAGLIHADWMHLGFNMYALYLFGGIVEHAFESLFPGFGMTMYLVLYISALVMSSLFSFYKHKENPRYNALGASGAVSAILFASIIIFPSQKLMIFPIPFFYSVLYSRTIVSSVFLLYGQKRNGLYRT